MIEEKVHRTGGRMGGGKTDWAGAGPGDGSRGEEEPLLPAPLFLLLWSLRGAGVGCTGWLRRERRAVTTSAALVSRLLGTAGERLGVDGSLYVVVWVEHEDASEIVELEDEVLLTLS